MSHLENTRRNHNGIKVDVLFFLVTVGILIDSGLSQFDENKFSFCDGLSRLIYNIFGGENTNMKYMLYTRSNPEDDCDLQPTEEALSKCKFNAGVRTVVLIPGWERLITKQSQFFDLKDKLLEAGNFNVVVYNWTYYSNTYNYTDNSDINYRFGVVNSYYAGLKLSAWIHYLQLHGGADPRNFHLISHSLGDAVCHIAAKPICHLGFVTYLDAAALTVRHLPTFLQPSSTDADFVEAIHTNGALNESLGDAYLRPIADIDYYPNGGQMQPYCSYGAKFKYGTGLSNTVNSAKTQISCSHIIVLQYYIASFNKTCKFLGRICDSYENFTSGKCSNAPICRMGFYSKMLPDPLAHSRCYLTTSANPPFCLD